MFWNRKISLISLSVGLFSIHISAFVFPQRIGGRNTGCKPTVNMLLSPTMKDYVKVDLSISKDGKILNEAPYDQGKVGFVIGGGRFFKEINEFAETTAVGESVKFSCCVAEFNAEMTAKIPIENAPGGLRVGDLVQMANGMSVRVSEVTEEFISIDANPPLAGQLLDIEMKILQRYPHNFLKQATFAAGCFWGLELAFQRVEGVAFTAVGYTHGQIDNPSYEEVCEGTTGHAEAVTILYNPEEVSFEELLNVFWSRHDPTQLNGQGNDIGTQYRGGIYYHSEEQKISAEKSMTSLQTELGKPLATELLPSSASKFWMSEDYHQQYLEKGGQSGMKTAVEKIRCYG
jgi:peptide-methionine (S)-S-oxide reductase